MDLYFVTAALIIASAITFITFNKIQEHNQKGSVSSEFPSRYAASANRAKTLKFLIPALLLAALIGTVAAKAIRVVDSTEALVVRTFGKVSSVKTAGLQCLNPYTETGATYVLSTRQVDLSMDAYSKDAQALTVSLTTQYQLDRERLMDIASQYGSQTTLEDKITKIIEARTKVAFSRDSAMTIVETREQLSPRVLSLVSEIEDMYFIEILNLEIVDISFSDVFENAVEQKMLAEQEKLKAEYEKEQAEIKAEQEKSVRTTQAEADLEVARKKAEATVITAQAEADALKIQAQQLNSMSPELRAYILQQMFYDSWDGILPRIMSGGDSGMLIDPSTLLE
ncbi:MAG: hypothetical protein LBD85_02870 [Oscillospiraceae bacterium]|jgi:regulator of protease activity HflC (stomatin/prohibitin superfamily)|nr:hypothetical protein [Oscillospiraceae bacterium]